MENTNLRIFLKHHVIRCEVSEEIYSKIVAALKIEPKWLHLFDTSGMPLHVHAGDIVAMQVIKPSPEVPLPGVTIKALAMASGIPYRTLYYRAKALPKGSLDKLSDRKLDLTEKNLELLKIPEEKRKKIWDLVKNEKNDVDQDADNS